MENKIIELIIQRLLSPFKKKREEALSFVETINVNDFVQDETINIADIFENTYLFDSYYESFVVANLRSVALYPDDKHAKNNVSKIIRLVEYAEHIYRVLILMLVLKELSGDINSEVLFEEVVEENRVLRLPDSIPISEAAIYLNKLESLFYDAFEKYDEDTLFIKQPVNLFNETLLRAHGGNDDCFEMLKQLFKQTDGKVSGSKTRCVALVEYEKERFVSISGSSCDYDGVILSKNSGWCIEKSHKEVYEYIKKDVITYKKACHLIDSCLSYTLFNVSQSRFPFSVKDLLSFSNSIFSCCERKILSNLEELSPKPVDKQKLVVYVKFAPCDKCIPALEGVDNIIYTDKGAYSAFTKGDKSIAFSDVLRFAKVKNGKLVEK